MPLTVLREIVVPTLWAVIPNGPLESSDNSVRGTSMLMSGVWPPRATRTRTPGEIARRIRAAAHPAACFSTTAPRKVTNPGCGGHCIP